MNTTAEMTTIDPDVEGCFYGKLPTNRRRRREVLNRLLAHGQTIDVEDDGLFDLFVKLGIARRVSLLLLTDEPAAVKWLEEHPRLSAPPKRKRGDVVTRDAAPIDPTI